MNIIICTVILFVYIVYHTAGLAILGIFIDDFIIDNKKLAYKLINMLPIKYAKLIILVILHICAIIWPILIMIGIAIFGGYCTIKSINRLIENNLQR